jgi:membrane-bound lytic murein transglycosylase D
MDDEPQLSRPLSVLLFLLIGFWPAYAEGGPALSPDAAADRIMTLVEDDVKARLQSLDQEIVEHRYAPEVRSIIRRYVERWRNSSGQIIGRTTIYFPLIEAKLREYGLPDALKYLTITESALRVTAESRVGAVGLWQLMPGTAREIGLRINDEVDERMEPIRATEAGLEYLVRQYEYFGDWALALAAYNSGPGNVRRARRRSRSTDYWRLRRYLPRETRLYVPGFIAATYLAEFYARHDIEVEMPELDLQLTEVVHVPHELSFYRIMQVTGLPLATIRRLNPAYLRGYLPASPRGNYVIVPARVATALRDYVSHQTAADPEPYFPAFAPFPDREREDPEPYYQELHTVTAPQDTSLLSLSRILETSRYVLAVWNNFCPTDRLDPGREVRYYRIREFRALKTERERRRRYDELGPLSLALPSFLEPARPTVVEAAQTAPVFWTMRKKMRLRELAEEHQLDVERLSQLNAASPKTHLRRGTQLRLR